LSWIVLFVAGGPAWWFFHDLKRILLLEIQKLKKLGKKGGEFRDGKKKPKKIYFLE